MIGMIHVTSKAVVAVAGTAIVGTLLATGGSIAGIVIGAVTFGGVVVKGWELLKRRFLREDKLDKIIQQMGPLATAVTGISSKQDAMEKRQKSMETTLEETAKELHEHVRDSAGYREATDRRLVAVEKGH